MARLPRLYVEGCAQHIIQRGNNRNPCFINDLDYNLYLTKLKEYSEQHSVDIHAYVLMTNHVHLLVTPHDQNGVSRMMQSLGRYYVRYFNSAYQRTGTLWEGRYKSALVDNERYLLTVYRYIELNPVRAEIVDLAQDYPWSSYQVNAQQKPNKLITPHSSYKALGTTNELRKRAYRGLFKHPESEKIQNEIRDMVKKEAIIGSDAFKRQIERLANRRVSTFGHGGDRRSLSFKGSES